MTAHNDPARQARIAALRAAVEQERRSGSPDIPEALQTDLAALRAAGLDFIVVSSSPLPAPSPPLREITAQEVAGLDARDPRRALHRCQQAHAALGLPVPARIINNLRAAAKDEARKRRKRRP